MSKKVKTAQSEKPTQILIIGIGGYGQRHYEAVSDLEADGLADLVAIVDPSPEKAPAWPEIKERGTPTFASLEAFFKGHISADLAIVVSPISFHADQTCSLLEAGIHVHCEKPIAATVSDALRMRAARDRSGCILEIGYQWSYSEAIQSLKADILGGLFGRAQTLLTRVCWPRTSQYYGRNGWAGKSYNLAGEPIYDSPVNNATAHYLHNMLFVLGAAPHLSATPAAITAESYRVNPIESFDTACCRIETEEGSEIYFYTTHASKTTEGPQFTYHFQKGRIDYLKGEHIIATFSDGSVKDYGDPERSPMQKILYCVQQVRSPEYTPCCSVEAAIAHTGCVQAFQEIPVTQIESSQYKQLAINREETLSYIPEIETHIRSAFHSRKLFSEMDLPWTKVSNPTPIP